MRDTRGQRQRRAAGGGDPAVHGVDVARPVDEHDAAVSETSDVVDEQPDRAGLVHDDVVTPVGPRRLTKTCGTSRTPGGLSGQPQRGGQQEAVGAALLDQVAVGVRRLGLLGRLLHAS